MGIDLEFIKTYMKLDNDIKRIKASIKRELLQLNLEFLGVREVYVLYMVKEGDNHKTKFNKYFKNGQFSTAITKLVEFGLVDLTEYENRANYNITITSYGEQCLTFISHSIKKLLTYI